MKLLFDENLSPRLVTLLADLFPGSVHLRDCELRGASDDEVWRYAQQHGFSIVSKDSDFSRRSVLQGCPPKVIWLDLGNCTTMRAELVLRNMLTRILAFEQGEQSCLVLRTPRRG